MNWLETAALWLERELISPALHVHNCTCDRLPQDYDCPWCRSLRATGRKTDEKSTI